MFRYCKSDSGEIKLVSMESEEKWHKEAVDHFDFDKYRFVDIKLSALKRHRYSFVTGMIYEKIPDYPYDFIFVDGPYYGDMCDMDFIKIAENSNRKVSALIDSRRTSALAYSVLLGRDKVLYYPFGFSLIKDVSKEDLILTNKRSLHHSFNRNIPKTHNLFINNFFSSLALCLLPMRYFD